MKIAVSAQEKDLNTPVDPRLGRAQHFLLIDTERMECDRHSHRAPAFIAGVVTSHKEKIKGKPKIGNIILR